MTKHQKKPFFSKIRTGSRNECADNSTKGFFVQHKAWHSEILGRTNPEIIIGVYHQDGSTDGEFTIKWTDHKQGRGWVPCLEAYGDSWQVFFELPELHRVLRNAGRDVSPEWMITQLTEECGYIDMTSYERPHG